MKKVVVFINGEGLGHTLDFLALYPFLEKAGFEILKIIKGETGKTKDLFLKGFSNKLIHYPQGKLIFSKKRVNWLEVTKNNVNILIKNRSLVAKIREEIKALKPDLILRFSDACASFACIGMSVPQVWIGNQVKLLDKKFFENETKHLALVDKLFQRFFLNLLNTGVSHRLNLNPSPYEKEVIQLSQTISFPALLREEIKSKDIGSDYLAYNEFILCYLYQDWQINELKEFARANPQENLVVFWGGAEFKVMKNLTLFKKSSEKYIHYLKKAKAVISNSGKTTHAEVLYLNKPLVAIPLHYEQELHIKRNPLAIKGENFKDILNYRKVKLLSEEEHIKIKKEFNDSPLKMAKELSNLILSFKKKERSRRKKGTKTIGASSSSIFSTDIS